MTREAAQVHGPVRRFDSYMQGQLDYSIVVPAYNEEALLGATLASIRAAIDQTDGWRGEIIVVDNASTDRTPEIALSHGARVQFEAHRQIARARNAGAAVAQGRWLVFVDADTEISAEVLRASLAALASDGCVGGGAPVDARHPYRSLRIAIGLWNLVSRHLRWACGAYLFCRADAFADVGGFDERFYATEELWLSSKLRRWGQGRDMRMQIVDAPISTSARKLDWYGPAELAGTMLRLLLWPGRLRDPEACRLWYARPEPRPSSLGGDPSAGA